MARTRSRFSDNSWRKIDHFRVIRLHRWDLTKHTIPDNGFLSQIPSRYIGNIYFFRSSSKYVYFGYLVIYYKRIKNKWRRRPLPPSRRAYRTTPSKEKMRTSHFRSHASQICFSTRSITVSLDNDTIRNFINNSRRKEKENWWLVYSRRYRCFFRVWDRNSKREKYRNCLFDGFRSS